MKENKRYLTPTLFFPLTNHQQLWTSTNLYRLNYNLNTMNHATSVKETTTTRVLSKLRSMLRSDITKQTPKLI